MLIVQVLAMFEGGSNGLRFFSWTFYDISAQKKKIATQFSKNVYFWYTLMLMSQKVVLKRTFSPLHTILNNFLVNVFTHVFVFNHGLLCSFMIPTKIIKAIKHRLPIERFPLVTIIKGKQYYAKLLKNRMWYFFKTGLFLNKQNRPID